MQMYKKYLAQLCYGHSYAYFRLIITMKLSLILVLLVGLQAQAHVFAQKATIKMENTTVKAVLKELKRQTKVEFLYLDDELDDQRLVSVHLVNKPLTEILEQCLAGQEVTYTVDNAFILIKRNKLPNNVQEEQLISGTVTDKDGNALVGASVLLKSNTKVSTSVKADGTFALKVPAGSIITVTYIGYVAKDIQIGSQQRIQVILDEEDAQLEEVVVVGYGTVARKDLTGAVASVGASQIQDLAVARLDQALLGKIPGVQVMPISGAPGAEPQIRIRGVGSISASSKPLYVVDGFPTDNIQTLNPSDIESMDILKDASATAIYGSRGANGVVIVNTKRGKIGKPTIGFDSYYGIQTVSKTPDFMDVRQQAQYYYDGIRNRNIDAGAEVSGNAAEWRFRVPQTVLDVLDGTNTTRVDALDYVLRTAPQQQYQLSASGGNESVKYAISGEFFDQDGIVVNSNFKRYSFRSNLDVKLTERLNVQLNLNGAFMDENKLTESGWGGGANESVIAQATSAQLYYPVLNTDGSYFVYRDLDASTNLFNPLALANEITNTAQTGRFLGNINASYQINNEFKLNLMAGATYNNLREMRFVPQLPAFLNGPPNGADNTATIVNWISEATLNYNKQLGNHSIAALIGTSAQKESIKTNMLASNNFPNNLVPYLNAVSGVFTDGGADLNDWSLLSYLSRFNYNYKGKYYVTASVRTDGSSRFGNNSKYGVFPSAALAWRMSQESFLKDIAFLDDMKMRLSYGQTGNNNIGNYEHYATVMYYKYNFGGNVAGGYAPDRLANPDLTWEKQRSFNFGLDVSILKNRIAFSADYFNSRNTDLLLNVNVPAVTGFNTTLQNIGEVKNTGFEFVLNTRNISKAFTWDTDLNLSTYRNEVLRLGPSGDPIISERHITMIGKPIGMFYGLLTDGVFRNQQELDAGPIYNPGAPDRSRVGDQRFKDISGPNGVPDGVINSYDYTIIGSPYPDFYYGMTNRFAYKNWSLNVSLQGAYGNQITSTANDIRLTTRSRSKTLDTQLGYWQSEQQPGDGQTPRPNDAPTGGVRTVSTRYLDSGSYLRINNITLGYQLPSTWVERLRMSSLRIYLTANNPFIITKNTSFNPDVSTGTDALTPGIDYNNYPLPKSFLLGLNVRF